MAKRPRGSTRHRRERPSYDAFEALVTSALDSIPDPFARALDEVAIVIEDEPTLAQLRDAGLRPGDGLYGLYEGIPRNEYAADWGFSPNKISLFRRALEEDFDDRDELEREVWITVIHELAHHLGIDEGRLRDLGVD